jgi:CBS-domain-containing membrane protein
VFLFEMTGDYQVILPLMVATVLATLVASGLSEESLMTGKLVRRGLRIHTRYEVDVFQTTSVQDVMTPAVKTLPANASVAEARRRFWRAAHGAYPLVDGEGKLAGIVTRGDLLRFTDADGRPVRDVASRDVVTVDPSDPLIVALQRMLDEDIEHLPVVQDGRLVGMCTRTDILRARRRQFEHERLQEGWGSRPGNGR